MERLTEYMGNGENYESINPIDTPYEYGKANLQALINKLAAYEDAEEQGLLLRLLCGIGADVYIIPSKVNYELNILNQHPENNKVYHQKVASVTFTEKGWYIECDKDREYGTGRILPEKNVQGNLVFITRGSRSQVERNGEKIMGYIRVLEEKQIEERCSNCLYCGSNGVTCANANNSGKPMVFVNGGRACKWYWLNQNKYRRI